MRDSVGQTFEKYLCCHFRGELLEVVRPNLDSECGILARVISERVLNFEC